MEVLSKFFALIFTGSQASPTSHIPKDFRQWRGKKNPSPSRRRTNQRFPHEVEYVQLYKARQQASRVLKELAAVVVKSLSITFEKSQLSDKAPGYWKKGNITSAFKKGRKEDQGNWQFIIT